MFLLFDDKLCAREFRDSPWMSTLNRNTALSKAQSWLILHYSLATVREWVSSFLTAHQHIIGYSVPYNGLENAIKDDWQRCEIGCKLVLFTNRKWYSGFRLVPKSMALIDGDATLVALPRSVSIGSLSCCDWQFDSASKHDQILVAGKMFHHSTLHQCPAVWQTVTLIL